MLNCRDRSISLYLAYDPVNHRIAIAKPDIVRRVNVRPLKFDAARGYASGAGLIAKYRIPAQAHRYTYVGKERGGEYNGWLVFQREHYEAPDDKLPECRLGGFARSRPCNFDIFSFAFNTNIIEALTLSRNERRATARERVKHGATGRSG